MLDTTITLEDIKQTQAQIKNYVRRTPLIAAKPVKNPVLETDLYLKLELLQISGSFKARGATSKLLSLPRPELERGIITASGGNHGLGVAYAGWLAKVPTTIYLPHNTPAVKAEKLADWGAKVVFAGNVWDEANSAALQAAATENLVYFHPFADKAVIAGQGTVGLEIMEDLPDVDVVVVAIGGGGLISGVSLALKTLRPGVRIIGVEPTGAPTLLESLKAGQVVELAEVKTAAGTLAPRQSDKLNFEIIRQNVDEIVLVTDEEMRQAARWLWSEFGVAAELSGAAATAALMFNRVAGLQPSQKVCSLVCGAGTDGL